MVDAEANDPINATVSARIIGIGNKLKKIELLTRDPMMVMPATSDESSAAATASIHDDKVVEWERSEDNDSNNSNDNDDNNSSGGDNDGESTLHVHIENGSSNNLDDYDNNFPIDLSNDIAVNQMLADQGAPYNPDAEIFNVHEYDAGQQRTVPTSQEELSLESKSFEYSPYYYVNQQNQYNRPAAGNQFEKLTKTDGSIGDNGSIRK